MRRKGGGEGKAVGRVGDGILGKVIKKEGKHKVGEGKGRERMLSYCNVLYICGIILASLFIAAGSD